MAGHDEGNGIATERDTHGAGEMRAAESVSEDAVASGFTPRDRLGQCVNVSLEGGRAR